MPRPNLDGELDIHTIKSIGNLFDPQHQENASDTIMLNNTPPRLILLLGLLLAIALFPVFNARASEKPEPVPTDKADHYAAFNQTVLSTLASETTIVPQLTYELEQLQSRKGGFETELATYRVQLSTHGNLLTIPNTNIKDLEKAALNNRATLEYVTNRIQALTQQADRTIQAIEFNRDQSRLNEKQLSAIKSEAVDIQNATALMGNLNSLLATLSKKQKLLDDLNEAYTRRKKELAEIQSALAAISLKFEDQIKTLKKEKLFQRSRIPSTLAQWRQSIGEIAQLKHMTGTMMTATFWASERVAIDRIGWGPLISAILIFVAFVIFLFRLQRLCYAKKDASNDRLFPWRTIGLAVFGHGLPLFGITLYLYVFTHFYYLDDLPLVKAGLSILWAFVFTRWTLDLFVFSGRGKNLPPTLNHIVNIRTMVYSIRLFASLYIWVEWLVVDSGAALFVLRILFEARMLVWFISICRKLRRAESESRLGETSRYEIGGRIFIILGYIIFFAGPLIEISGYGAFAIYWYTAWGRSIVAVLLAVITYMVLKEWHQSITGQGQKLSLEDPGEAKWPIKWVTYQFAMLVWSVAVLLALVFSWGASQAVIGNFIRALHYPINIGQMSFSLIGSVYAFLILFLTHLLSKITRYVLIDKLFSKSGIVQGLQESISSISAYALWGLGILFALHAFGLNTTSLAVALGALGIGLGFGLQNIFNNFISGIILLFERPIQVGDEVEINGIWSTVKKINVRSTVVQTWDSAAIIIPNSEFISNQVVNWSFQDKYIRRKIQVGVAYGSDIELVRDTLLEIAAKTPHVLKNKKMEVIFSDFGDSALIFLLRYYTTTDHIWKTETSIRFEIDRLFKERNITIAFPQQDVHLRYLKDGADDKGPAELVPPE